MHCWFRRLFLSSLLIGVLLFGGGAFAQDASASSTTATNAAGTSTMEVAGRSGSDTTMSVSAPTTTPTTSPPTTAPGSSLISSGKALPAAIYALGFGLVAILLVLLFLFWDRRGSFKTVETLASERVAVSAQPAESLAGGGGLGIAPRAAPVAGAPSIGGAHTVIVGVPSSYSVQPTQPADTVVTWTLSPPGAGTLSSTRGLTTQMTPSKSGIITLQAQVVPSGAAGAQDANPVPLSLTINSLASGRSLTDRIPILGDGYGTVIIALGVISITAALGLTDVLNGEAVATIIASLVTYSVLRGTSGSGSSSSSNPSGGSVGGGGSPSGGS